VANALETHKPPFARTAFYIRIYKGYIYTRKAVLGTDKKAVLGTDKKAVLGTAKMRIYKDI